MSDLILLSILLFCHYLGDYTHLSTNIMLAAKQYGKPFLPILCHGLIHGYFILFALILFDYPSEKIIICFFIEIISHTIIDIVKGKLNKYDKIKDPKCKDHWYVFGFDQYLHQLILILIVYILK